MASFLVVNWSGDTVTIEKSTKVYCEELQPGGVVKHTVRNELWEGMVESVWGICSIFLNSVYFVCSALFFLMKLSAEAATGGVLVKSCLSGV